MGVADILDRAAALLEPKGAWICFYFGRTATGENVYADHPDAVSFCALGAIVRAGMEGGTEGRCRHYDAIDFLESRLGGRDVAEWNNEPGRTQSEVVATFREAAAKARAGVQP